MVIPIIRFIPALSNKPRAHIAHHVGVIGDKTIDQFADGVAEEQVEPIMPSSVGVIPSSTSALLATVKDNRQT